MKKFIAGLTLFSISCLGAAAECAELINPTHARQNMRNGLVKIAAGDSLPAAGQDRWRLELAAGVHSFYAPMQAATPGRPEFNFRAGLHRSLGKKEHFLLGVQAGFAKNKLQGNTYYAQALLQYERTILKTVTAGAGLGAGYGRSFHPSPALIFKNGEWVKTNNSKGLLLLPAQFSLGYKEIAVSQFGLSPFACYQLQVLAGYNPDLPILPVSIISAGVKIKKNKN